MEDLVARLGAAALLDAREAVELEVAVEAGDLLRRAVALDLGHRRVAAVAFVGAHLDRPLWVADDHVAATVEDANDGGSSSHIDKGGALSDRARVRRVCKKFSERPK